MYLKHQLCQMNGNNFPRMGSRHITYRTCTNWWELTSDLRYEVCWTWWPGLCQIWLNPNFWILGSFKYQGDVQMNPRTMVQSSTKSAHRAKPEGFLKISAKIEFFRDFFFRCCCCLLGAIFSTFQLSFYLELYLASDSHLHSTLKS